MTRYTSKYLEEEFKRKAHSRISKKKRGESKYANDAGYWDGGRCNWGLAHNLKEDCERLAGFFAGIAELKNAQQQLVKFADQKEFEKSKQDLLIKINNALDGLRMKTGNSTSIGGVCIIWDDFADHFDLIINNFRNEVERLKRDVENVPYHEAKELQKLLIEEKSLKNEIEENERKARNEPDKNKQKQFIFLVDQAKEQLKKVLERRKQLKTGRLGDNFDPNKYIDEFLKKLEDKLSGKNKPTRPLRTSSANPFSSGSGSNSNYQPDTNFPNNEYIPAYHDEPKPFLEKHWKELLLIGLFSLGAYYILN